MASVLKNEELELFRQTLLNLRARLRGDLNQMTDEALRRDQPDASGNLSNVPLHMADIGTENYDQEFTLELIENEQDTLGEVHEALSRIDAGTLAAARIVASQSPGSGCRHSPTRASASNVRGRWRTADE